MYYQLDAQSACKYVRDSSLMFRVFGSHGELRVTDLSDGNINMIFRVYDESAPSSKSLLLKQALPYARRYPEVKLPLNRAGTEFEALKLEGECCPEFVPRVYLYDPHMHLNVMEDMNKHMVLRIGLLRCTRLPWLSAHLGRFLAETLFHTSDLYLASVEKKKLVSKFINPMLCKISEDLVFTEPYVEHSNNRWNPALDGQIAALRKSETVRSEVLMLKRKFMCDAQALIHGDLHTGSVLANSEETKVIDPEFAYFGPMGFDVGTLIAHLVLSYASHRSSGGGRREGDGSYCDWLLGVIREVWEVMEREFCRLWEAEGNSQWRLTTFRQRYFRELVVDTAGFAGCEIVRRVVGLAHVVDLDGMEEEQARVMAESAALKIARILLLERNAFGGIGDIMAVISQAE